MILFSSELAAALTLQHAKRYVEQRFDGAWWELDRALWSVVPTLEDEERAFIVFYIHTQNMRRADRLA